MSGNVALGFREIIAVFRQRPFWFNDPLHPASEEVFAEIFVVQPSRAARLGGFMIPDESPRGGPETEALSALLGPANDNGSDADVAIDPRVQIIARSIGRQIAREQLDKLHAANDNRPNDEQ